MKRMLVGLLLAVLLIAVLAGPVSADVEYGWINGVPVYTDDTNLEWINGKPYIIINGVAAGWINILSINGVTQTNVSTIFGTAKLGIAAINGVTP